mgnify:FL=1
MKGTRKNARPEAATSGRAKGESTRESGNSQNQHTTADDGGQVAVSSLLMEGRSNALHLADLVRRTGWPERDVRKAIQRERQRGCPILSDNKSGYFLPQSEAEKVQFVCSMRCRAREILRAANAVARVRVGEVE